MQSTRNKPRFAIVPLPPSWLGLAAMGMALLVNLVALVAIAVGRFG